MRFLRLISDTVLIRAAPDGLASVLTRAAPPELSPLFLCPMRLPHRNLDAERRHELARLSHQRRSLAARRGQFFPPNSDARSGAFCRCSRGSRRPLKIIARDAGAIDRTSLLAAILTLSGRVQVWHLMALSGLQGLINAIDVPARQSLIVGLIDDR